MSNKLPFETLRGRAALAGITLTEIEDGSGGRAYVVSRWTLTKALPNLKAVSAWLDLAAAPEPVLAGAGGQQ